MAVRLTLPPLKAHQLSVGLAVMVTDSVLPVTETVVEELALHPLESVTTTVYVVVEPIPLTAGSAAVSDESPEGGLQK